jgi:ABC-type phosphate transport system substrate-binding protein
VTINALQIGGSGVVVIEHGAGVNGFIQENAVDCNGITKTALQGIYGATGGFFALGAYAAGTVTDCSAAVGATGGFIQSATITPQTTGGAGTYTAICRSDPSGTQDTMNNYLTGQTTTNLTCGATASGNAGVLAAVKATANSIGFVDLGFAEGLPSSAVATCPNAGVACFGIAQVSSFDTILLGHPATTTAATATANGYVNTGASTAPLHAFIKTALGKLATVNPLTNTGFTNVYPDASGSLARVFFYVTNGAPTPVEENFLSFMTQPSATSYFDAQGYFSFYEYTTA